MSSIVIKMQQEDVKNIKNKEVVFKEEETKTQNKRTVSNTWFSADVFDLCKKKSNVWEKWEKNRSFRDHNLINSWKSKPKNKVNKPIYSKRWSFESEHQIVFLLRSRFGFSLSNYFCSKVILRHLLLFVHLANLNYMRNDVKSFISTKLWSDFLKSSWQSFVNWVFSLIMCR